MPRRIGAPLYVVAGFPAPLSQNITASLSNSKDLPNALYVQAPSNKLGPIYQEKTVDSLLKAIGHKMRNHGNNTSGLIEPSRLILLYLPDDSSEILLNGFGLSCFPIPIGVEDNEKDAIRRIPNFAATRLKELVTTLPCSNILLVEHEVSKKAKKTPLLLPAKNFFEPSTGLPISRWFFDLVNQSEEWTTANQRLRMSRLTREELPKLTARRTNAFVDSRNLCFPPADLNEMHGFVRDIDSSSDTTVIKHWLNSKYRFGVPILNSGFHYDVQLKGGRSLAHLEFECELQGMITTREKYVNIYPNDFVRT